MRDIDANDAWEMNRPAAEFESKEGDAVAGRGLINTPAFIPVPCPITTTMAKALHCFSSTFTDPYSFHHQ